MLATADFTRGDALEPFRLDFVPEDDERGDQVEPSCSLQDLRTGSQQPGTAQEQCEVEA